MPCEKIILPVWAPPPFSLCSTLLRGCRAPNGGRAPSDAVTTVPQEGHHLRGVPPALLPQLRPHLGGLQITGAEIKSVYFVTKRQPRQPRSSISIIDQPWHGTYVLEHKAVDVDQLLLELRHHVGRGEPERRRRLPLAGALPVRHRRHRLLPRDASTSERDAAL
jgi:hypothetical protein